MNLLSVFDRLFQDEQFVDVTLACDGQLIKAHKMVLSASSAYFQQIFTLNPCTHPVVIMKDVRLLQLKQILQFIYKGEISVNRCDIPQLLMVAKALQIRGLEQMTHVDEPQPSTSTSKVCTRELRKANRSRRSMKRKHREASIESLVQIDDDIKPAKIQNSPIDGIALPNNDDLTTANAIEPHDTEPILIGSVRSLASEMKEELYDDYSNMDDSVSFYFKELLLLDQFDSIGMHLFVDVSHLIYRLR